MVGDRLYLKAGVFLLRAREGGEPREAIFKVGCVSPES